jgi:CheY-like chemotaxis protein
MENEVILVVEDTADDVFFLRRALKKAQIDKPLQVVVHGQEAVDYLSGDGKFCDRAKFPLPAMVLLDLKLPFLMVSKSSLGFASSPCSVLCQ